ncbi:MAG: hypothetical protein U1F35_10000 [Steroidobacteraceae bacterium]
MALADLAGLRRNLDEGIAGHAAHPLEGMKPLLRERRSHARRNFLKASRSDCADTGRRPIRSHRAGAHHAGLQLFTGCRSSRRTSRATPLKAIAQMGYKEVETIGSFGRDPKCRSILDRNGLEVAFAVSGSATCTSYFSGFHGREGEVPNP